MELVPYRLLTKAQRRQVDISIEVRAWYSSKENYCPTRSTKHWGTKWQRAN